MTEYESHGRVWVEDADDVGAEPDAEDSTVWTLTGILYHDSDCAVLKRTPMSRLGSYETPEQAVENGLEPCGRCQDGE